MEQTRKSLIVRAYDMARSGRFPSNAAIRSALLAEAYERADVDRHFSEAPFNRDLEQLRKLPNKRT